jgi:hypothetical protein
MDFAAIEHGGTSVRLRPVRRRDVLHRQLYTVKHPGPRGDRLDHTVEIDAGRDDGRAVLYVDGRERATTDMPGSFPVAGGVIEVAIGLHGVQRVHLVGDDGTERRLVPVPGTLEDLRGRVHRRHPWLSRIVGWLAIAILVVDLVLGVPQALEFLTTRVDRIAELFGTFTSPIVLPLWLTITLALAGAVAGVERSLTLRHNRLLDLETSWTGL